MKSEKKPVKRSNIMWEVDDTGNVTLKIKNNSIIKRILNQPVMNYIHLDELGSFVWEKIDGKRDVCEIGDELENYFPEKAEPIMERLNKYLAILKSYKLIEWV